MESRGPAITASGSGILDGLAIRIGVEKVSGPGINLSIEVAGADDGSATEGGVPTTFLKS